MNVESWFDLSNEKGLNTKQQEIVSKQIESLKITDNVEKFINDCKDTKGLHANKIMLAILHSIATKINPSFQNLMTQFFNENRQNIGLSLACNDKDAGFKDAPIKTKSRVYLQSLFFFVKKIKIKIKIKIKT